MLECARVVALTPRLLKEIGIKSCREVRFSNGGAFFAAANNAAVQVYSSYTAENVGNLRHAHSRAGSSARFASRMSSTLPGWCLLVIRRRNLRHPHQAHEGAAVSLFTNPAGHN